MASLEEKMEHVKGAQPVIDFSIVPDDQLACVCDLLSITGEYGRNVRNQPQKKIKWRHNFYREQVRVLVRYGLL